MRAVIAASDSLLDPDEPAPARVVNPGGTGPFVFICEHASNAVPRRLGDLGLAPADLASHIAWDPGAGAVAVRLGAALDAPLVAATWSRLVYDCNRPPDNPAAIPETSAGVRIPANISLDEAGRAARVVEIYAPFRRTVRATLDARGAVDGRFAIVTIHSFTPVIAGSRRTVEFGVLYDTDTRLADALLAAGPARPGLKLARNSPYGPDDGVMHTLRVDAAPRGVPHVMLEIRNDLIATGAQVRDMAEALAPWLRAAWARLPVSPDADANTADARPR